VLKYSIKSNSFVKSLDISQIKSYKNQINTNMGHDSVFQASHGE
jgi:hypothetical protein